MTPIIGFQGPPAKLEYRLAIGRSNRNDYCFLNFDAVNAQSILNAARTHGYQLAYGEPEGQSDEESPGAVFCSPMLAKQNVGHEIYATFDRENRVT